MIDDPSLSFDIGRKSVHGRQQGALRDIAYEAFNRYFSDIQKYLGAGADVFESMGDREETFEEISNLPDLDTPKTAFKKRPNDQEATVVAMFFEQVGRGEFQDVIPLISGYKRRYDLYARWKTKQVVIEFKFNLQGLFKDFNDETKMFNDINVVVLWEITEQDRVEARRHGISLESLQPGSVPRSRAFPGSTYLMTMGPNAVVFVVEMKDVVQAD